MTIEARLRIYRSNPTKGEWQETQGVAALSARLVKGLAPSFHPAGSRRPAARPG